LSMKTVCHGGAVERVMTAPVALVVSALAPGLDITRTLTPQMKQDRGQTQLGCIDHGTGRHRLGGSALAQVYGQLGDRCPDLDDVPAFKSFFAAMQELNERGLLLAYHDRSDGGLFTALCEMAFAGRCGFEVDLDGFEADPLPV